MPDSVLMPAPVNALMVCADRASSISAASDGSGSPTVVVRGRMVTLNFPSPEPTDHVLPSQLALCPYGLDGTMRSLAQCRFPAHSTRSGADPCHGAKRARSPTGDALAQAMKRGHAMMISQPAIICLSATWQRLLRKSAGPVESAATQV